MCMEMQPVVCVVIQMLRFVIGRKVSFHVSVRSSLSIAVCLLGTFLSEYFYAVLCGQCRHSHRKRWSPIMNMVGRM